MTQRRFMRPKIDTTDNLKENRYPEVSDYNNQGSNPNDIDISKFLYNFLMRRFQRKKILVDLMMVSIIYSCFLLRNRFDECDIFYNFLTDHYKPVDLSYFIFVRAVIEKELRVLFFDRNTGKSIDTREIFLSQKQMGFVLERIFGYGNSTKINRFFQNMYALEPSLRYEDNIKVYKFMKIALVDYFKSRKLGSMYSNREEHEIILDLTPKNYTVNNLNMISNI